MVKSYQNINGANITDTGVTNMSMQLVKLSLCDCKVQYVHATLESPCFSMKQ